MIRNWFAVLLLGLSVLLLSTCGTPPSTGGQGGNSGTTDGASDTSDSTASTTPTDDFGGGAGGTGNGPISIYGSITGFGSVWVNGVEFETPSDITIDGEPASESDLRVGMVVRVSGDIDEDGVSGTAEQIVYETAVHGPISDIPVEDTEHMTTDFTVLGVTVRIEPGVTYFDGGAYSYGLVAQNDIVAVSGFFNENGVLLASYIAKAGVYDEADGAIDVSVSGSISGLDAAGSFQLGSLTVSYDPTGASTDLSQIDGGTLADGMEVFVEGSLVAPNEVFATAIIPVSSAGPQDGDFTSVEGIVSGYNSVSDFTVNGQPVDASSAVFVPQAYSTVLHDGQRVVVEGTLVDGILVADKVTKRFGKIFVWSPLRSLDMESHTITLSVLDGEPGFDVSFDDKTHVTDPLDKGVLADFLPGDYLKVKALLNDDGGWTATHVMRPRVIKPIRVTAALEAKDADARTLTQLGMTYAVDESAVITDDNGDLIGIDTFFAQVNLGAVLKVRFDQPTDNVADMVDVDFE